MLKIGSRPIRLVSIIALVLVSYWIIGYFSMITSQRSDGAYFPLFPIMVFAALVLFISFGITRNNPKAYAINKKLLSRVSLYFWFEIITIGLMIVLVFGFVLWHYVADILIKNHIISWQGYN